MLAESKGGKFLSEKYSNNRVKYLWQCSNGHEWNMAFRNAKSGQWCPKCSIKKRSEKNRPSIEECHKIAKTKKGFCLSTQYFYSKTKYEWMCKEGHKWKASYDKIKQGRWCPKCATLNRSGNLNDCIALAKERGGKCLSTEYKNNYTKLLWECKEGHKWYSKYRNIQSGSWCPKCSLKHVGSVMKDIFLKKYGVANPFQLKSVKKKIRKTNLEKYGCEYPQQNKEIAMKAAKASGRSYILQHWETGEELVCQASYEKAVVEHFNKNKTNFLWQPETFTMLNGKKYRPDCYLPDQDLWVEIKGYFRKDAQEKWQRFQSVYPNSELWDEKRLKDLKIL
jgi:hypothetical protein